MFIRVGWAECAIISLLLFILIVSIAIGIRSRRNG